LYLFLFDDPKKEISVKGLFNRVKKASIVGHAGSLTYKVLGGAPWAGLPGVLWVQVPRRHLDQQVTVVKLELDKPLELYRGHGKVITAN
jgi:alpha-L-fucosidase